MHCAFAVLHSYPFTDDLSLVEIGGFGAATQKRQSDSFHGMVVPCRQQRAA